MTRILPKGRERLLIERILQESQSPLSPRELATLTGLDIDKVHRSVSAIVKAREAHAVCERRNASTYSWGPPPIVERETDRHIPVGRYTGEELRPYTGRPGAMDAFNIPSRFGDVTTPRVPPVLITSKVQDRRDN